MYDLNIYMYSKLPQYFIVLPYHLVAKHVDMYLLTNFTFLHTYKKAVQLYIYFICVHDVKCFHITCTN